MGDHLAGMARAKRITPGSAHTTTLMPSRPVVGALKMSQVRRLQTHLFGRGGRHGRRRRIGCNPLHGFPVVGEVFAAVETNGVGSGERRNGRGSLAAPAGDKWTAMKVPASNPGGQKHLQQIHGAMRLSTEADALFLRQTIRRKVISAII